MIPINANRIDFFYTCFDQKNINRLSFDSHVMLLLWFVIIFITIADYEAKDV